MPTRRTRLGTWGERAARDMLQHKGYQVVEANYRCRWGEIDLVCQRDDSIVFVEVRARRSLEFGSPQESLSKAKQARLVQAAQTYLEDKSLANMPWRIDLVCVTLDRQNQTVELEHLENVVSES